MFVGKQFVVLLVMLIVVTVPVSSSGRYPTRHVVKPYYSFHDYGAGVCHPSPCKNGGLCRSWYGRAFCTCPHGYTGRKCEHKVDICKSNTCQNGGTCEGHGYGFSCKCPPLYIGTLCETVPCVSDLDPRSSFKKRKCAKCDGAICRPVIVGSGDKRESRVKCAAPANLCPPVDGIVVGKPIKGQYCNDDDDCDDGDACDAPYNICCTTTLCPDSTNNTPDLLTHCDEDDDCPTTHPDCDTKHGVCCGPAGIIPPPSTP